MANPPLRSVKLKDGTWAVVDYRGRIYQRFPTWADAQYFIAAMAED